MAQLAELEQAFLKAHEAGDTDSAQVLADEIRRMRATPTPISQAPNMTVYTPPEEGLRTAAAGFGKAIVDAGRGIGQLTGQVSAEDVETARRRDDALMKTRSGWWANMLGNAGMLFTPGLLAKGLSLAPKIPLMTKLMPSLAPKAAEALDAAGNTLLLPKSVPQAVAVGAGQGAIQPAVTPEERALNTGAGATATALVPAAGAALRTTKALAEPLYTGGQQNIIGRLLNKAAGSEADATRQAMLSAQEFVPGSSPTAAQASLNPGIAAVERTVAQTTPEAITKHAARHAEQNAARVAEIEELAGTTGERDFAIANRAATAEQLYDTARKAGIDPAKITPEIQSRIADVMERSWIKDAITEARTKAQNEGIDIADPTGSVKGLDYVKRALDARIEGFKRAGDNDSARVATALKERLTGIIDKLSPDYAAARKVYAEMSKPVNQMEVAQAIADGSIDKLKGTLSPAKYARLLDDKTAARVTGFRGATLENTFTPEQLARLQALKEDLRRMERAQNGGKGVGSDTVQKLAYSNMIEAAGVPTWLNNIGGLRKATQMLTQVGSRAANRIYGKSNQEITNRLADALLDPRAAGEYMGALPISRSLRRTQNTLTPLGMGSAPALEDLTKQ